MSCSEAVIICTRNRPSDLHTTLESVVDQQGAEHRSVLIVDASDPAVQTQNRKVVDHLGTETWTHYEYNGQPSSSRQRNYGIDELSSSVEIVHFIDDDVTVEDEYFSELTQVLRQYPEVGGVGGMVVEPERTCPSTAAERIKYLFLLGHPSQGRILLSGCTTSSQYPTQNGASNLHTTEWLNGCSSYCRSLLDRHRFDETMIGYSMLEDLDLSYRISRETRLVVQPKARLLHRRSDQNRYDKEQYFHNLLIHRRWFLEKHFSGIRSRLAYWWSIIGHFLALSTSSDPQWYASLIGILRGIQSVWTRDHSLLQ